MSLFSTRCASCNTEAEAVTALLITTLSLGLLEKSAIK